MVGLESLLETAAFRVALDCGTWIREHAVGSSEMRDFWAVLEPLRT